MPRANDTDQDKAAGGAPLRFTETVECPDCEVEFEATWVDDSMDAEQIVDAPVGEQTCPNGHTHEYTYSGWMHYGEA